QRDPATLGGEVVALLLQVRLEAPLGAAVRERHVHTGPGALPGDLAHLAHDGTPGASRGRWRTGKYASGPARTTTTGARRRPPSLRDGRGDATRGGAAQRSRSPCH